MVSAKSVTVFSPICKSFQKVKTSDVYHSNPREKRWEHTSVVETSTHFWIHGATEMEA